ncbi:MAG: hypothetical protein KA419_08310 [Acidobacteria bacterium]|nr:hypothetical protein [Acidobacteriota bacterium]
MTGKVLTGLALVLLVTAASGCGSGEDIPEAADANRPPPIYVTAPAVPSPPPPLPENTPGAGPFLRPGRTTGSGTPARAAGGGTPEAAETPDAAVAGANPSTPPAPASPGGAVVSIGNKDFFGSIHEATGARPSQVGAPPAAPPNAARPGQAAPPPPASAPPPSAGQGTEIEQKAWPKIQRHKN